jgi:hypothetical protein
VVQLAVDTKLVEAVVLKQLEHQVVVVLLVMVLDLQFLLQVVGVYNFQRHSVILRVLLVVMDQHLQQSLVLIPQVSTGSLVVEVVEPLVQPMVLVVVLLLVKLLGQVVVLVDGEILLLLLQIYQKQLVTMVQMVHLVLVEAVVVLLVNLQFRVRPLLLVVVDQVWFLLHIQHK